MYIDFCIFLLFVFAQEWNKWVENLWLWIKRLLIPAPIWRAYRVGSRDLQHFKEVHGVNGQFIILVDLINEILSTQLNTSIHRAPFYIRPIYKVSTDCKKKIKPVRLWKFQRDSVGLGLLKIDISYKMALYACRP